MYVHHFLRKVYEEGQASTDETNMRVMSSNDERLSILNDWVDPRVNFVCLDYPNFLEHIDSFDGSSSESLE